jgi:serine kinase of HPr protein (carbohydrate metabolism regulator)
MTDIPKTQIHATCVELNGIGIVLRGPSGSGKSDLALRLIDNGARLVADDRINLTVEGGSLFASPPPQIAGRLEVRGIGIVPMPHTARVRVGMVVDLVAPQEVERVPDPARCEYLGIGLPLLALAPFEVSAPAKLRLAARNAALGRLLAA